MARMTRRMHSASGATNAPFLLLLLFLGALAVGCADGRNDPAAVAGKQLLLENVHVFDVHSGTMSGPATILVEGDRIRAVDEEVEAQAAAERIDCGGGYALPGFCDSHTHLANLTRFGEEHRAAALRGFVERGITHVRDVGGPVDLLAAMKKEIAGDVLSGPEIFYAGPMLEKAPLTWASQNEALPDFTVAVNTREDVDRIIPELAGKGASLIKTFGRFDDDVYARLVRTATEHGLHVAHDPGMPLFHAIPMDRAIAHGARTIEHAKAPWPIVLDEELQKEHDALLEGDHAPPEMMALAMKLFGLGADSISEERLLELIDGMKDAEAYFCPTLHVFIAMAKEEGGDGPVDPKMQAVVTLRGLGDQFTRIMAKRKVKFLVGQDGIDPDGTLCEMEHMKACGIGEAEILRAATLHPARCLGVTDRLGAIAPGLEADIVVLQKNPLDDIANVRTPCLVIRKGEIALRR